MSAYVKTYEEPEIDESGKIVAKMKSKGGKGEIKDKLNNDEIKGDELEDDEDDLSDLRA